MLAGLAGLMLLGAGCQSAAREPATAAVAAPGASSTGPALAAPLDRNLARPDVIAKSAPLPGFMRGLNLGNGLDAPTEGAWGVSLDDQHFAMAAAAGFDHVRLPARFSTPERTQVNAPFKVQEQFFQRVDWALERALEHRLSIIIDLHHYEEIHKDPAGHRQRFYAIWEQIAERYADRPAQVAFELLNEPNSALEPKLLNELTAEALRIVRKTNPTRLVFANCYAWANAERLAELQLPADDPHVIAQFHMYQPILFSHQGASWMGAAYQTLGVVFPGPPETPLTPVAASESEPWIQNWFSGYNRLPPDQNPNGPRAVFEHFDHAARYVQATSKRVYLGEFGVIDAADEQSRENWTWLVRTEAERRGIGWAYWDDGSRFKVMDPKTGQWNERLRRALLEP